MSSFHSPRSSPPLLHPLFLPASSSYQSHGREERWRREKEEEKEMKEKEKKVRDWREVRNHRSGDGGGDGHSRNWGVHTPRGMTEGVDLGRGDCRTSDRKRENFLLNHVSSHTYTGHDDDDVRGADHCRGLAGSGEKRMASCLSNACYTEELSSDSRGGVCTPRSYDTYCWRGDSHVQSKSLLGFPAPLLSDDRHRRENFLASQCNKKVERAIERRAPLLEKGERRDGLFSLGKNQVEGMLPFASTRKGEEEESDDFSRGRDLKESSNGMAISWGRGRSKGESNLLSLPQGRSPHLSSSSSLCSLEERSFVKDSSRFIPATTFVPEKKERKNRGMERDISLLREAFHPRENEKERAKPVSLISVFLPLAPMPVRNSIQKIAEEEDEKISSTFSSRPARGHSHRKPSSSSFSSSLRNDGRCVSKGKPPGERGGSKEDRSSSSSSFSSSSIHLRRVILERYPPELLREISSRIPQDPLLAKVANRGTADAFLSLRFLVSHEVFPSSSSSCPSALECPSCRGKMSLRESVEHPTYIEREEEREVEETRVEGEKERRREATGFSTEDSSHREKKKKEEMSRRGMGEVKEQEDEEQEEARESSRRRGEENKSRGKEGEDRSEEKEERYRKVNMGRRSHDTEEVIKTQAMPSRQPTLSSDDALLLDISSSSSCRSCSLCTLPPCNSSSLLPSPNSPSPLNSSPAPCDSSSSTSLSVSRSSCSCESRFVRLTFVWYRRRGRSMRLCIPRVPQLLRKVIFFFSSSVCSSLSSSSLSSQALPSSCCCAAHSRKPEKSSQRKEGKKEKEEDDLEEVSSPPPSSPPSSSSSSSSSSSPSSAFSSSLSSSSSPSSFSSSCSSSSSFSSSFPLAPSSSIAGSMMEMKSSGVCTVQRETQEDSSGVQTATSEGRRQFQDDERKEWVEDRREKQLELFMNRDEEDHPRSSSMMEKRGERFLDDHRASKEKEFLRREIPCHHTPLASGGVCTAEAFVEEKRNLSSTPILQNVYQTITSHAYWPRMKTSLDEIFSSSSSLSQGVSSISLSQPCENASTSFCPGCIDTFPSSQTFRTSLQRDDRLFLIARDKPFPSISPGITSVHPSSPTVPSTFPPLSEETSPRRREDYDGTTADTLSSCTRERAKEEEERRKKARRGEEEERRREEDGRFSSLSRRTPSKDSHAFSDGVQQLEGQGEQDSRLTIEEEKKRKTSLLSFQGSLSNPRQQNNSFCPHLKSIEKKKQFSFSSSSSSSWTFPSAAAGAVGNDVSSLSTSRPSGGILTEASFSTSPSSLTEGGEKSFLSSSSLPVSASFSLEGKERRREISCCFEPSVYEWLLTCKPGECLKDLEIHRWMGEPPLSSSSSSSGGAAKGFSPFSFIFRKSQEEKKSSSLSLIADRPNISPSSSFSSSKCSLPKERKMNEEIEIYKESQISERGTLLSLRLPRKHSSPRFQEKEEERENEKGEGEEQYYSLGEEKDDDEWRDHEGVKPYDNDDQEKKSKKKKWIKRNKLEKKNKREGSKDESISHSSSLPPGDRDLGVHLPFLGMIGDTSSVTKSALDETEFEEKQQEEKKKERERTESKTRLKSASLRDSPGSLSVLASSSFLSSSSQGGGSTEKKREGEKKEQREEERENEEKVGERVTTDAPTQKGRRSQLLSPPIGRRRCSSISPQTEEEKAPFHSHDSIGLLLSNQRTSPEGFTSFSSVSLRASSPPPLTRFSSSGEVRVAETKRRTRRSRDREGGDRWEARVPSITPLSQAPNKNERGGEKEEQEREEEAETKFPEHLFFSPISPHPLSSPDSSSSSFSSFLQFLSLPAPSQGAPLSHSSLAPTNTYVDSSVSTPSTLSLQKQGEEETFSLSFLPASLHHSDQGGQSLSSTGRTSPLLSFFPSVQINSHPEEKKKREGEETFSQPTSTLSDSSRQLHEDRSSHLTIQPHSKRNNTNSISSSSSTAGRFPSSSSLYHPEAPPSCSSSSLSTTDYSHLHSSFFPSSSFSPPPPPPFLPFSCEADSPMSSIDLCAPLQKSLDSRRAEMPTRGDSHSDTSTTERETNKGIPSSSSFSGSSSGVYRSKEISQRECFLEDLEEKTSLLDFLQHVLPLSSRPPSSLHSPTSHPLHTPSHLSQEDSSSSSGVFSSSSLLPSLVVSSSSIPFLKSHSSSSGSHSCSPPYTRPRGLHGSQEEEVSLDGYFNSDSTAQNFLMSLESLSSLHERSLQYFTATDPLSSSSSPSSSSPSLFILPPPGSVEVSPCHPHHRHHRRCPFLCSSRSTSPLLPSLSYDQTPPRHLPSDHKCRDEKPSSSSSYPSPGSEVDVLPSPRRSPCPYSSCPLHFCCDKSQEKSWKKIGKEPSSSSSSRAGEEGQGAPLFSQWTAPLFFSPPLLHLLDEKEKEDVHQEEEEDQEKEVGEEEREDGEDVGKKKKNCKGLHPPLCHPPVVPTSSHTRITRDREEEEKKIDGACVEGEERRKEEEEGLYSSSFLCCPRKTERGKDEEEEEEDERFPADRRRRKIVRDFTKKKIRQLLEHHDLLLPGVEAAEPPLLPFFLFELLKDEEDVEEETETAEKKAFHLSQIDPRISLYSSALASLYHLLASYRHSAPHLFFSRLLPQQLLLLLLLHCSYLSSSSSLSALPSPHSSSPMFLSELRQSTSKRHARSPSSPRRLARERGEEEEGEMRVSREMLAMSDKDSEETVESYEEKGHVRRHDKIEKKKKKKTSRRKGEPLKIREEEEGLYTLVPGREERRLRGRRIGLVSIDLFHLFHTPTAAVCRSPSSPASLLSSSCSGPVHSSVSSLHSQEGLSISQFVQQKREREDEEEEDQLHNKASCLDSKNDELHHGQAQVESLSSVSSSSSPPSPSCASSPLPDCVPLDSCRDVWREGENRHEGSTDDEEAKEEEEERDFLKPHHIDNGESGIDKEGKEEASSSSSSWRVHGGSFHLKRGTVWEAADGSPSERREVELGVEKEEEERKNDNVAHDREKGNGDGKWRYLGDDHKRDKKVEDKRRLPPPVFVSSSPAERLSKALWTACTYLQLDTLCVCLTTTATPSPSSVSSAVPLGGVNFASRCLGYRCISVEDIPKLPSLLQCWREELFLSSSSSSLVHLHRQQPSHLLLSTPSHFFSPIHVHTESKKETRSSFSSSASFMPTSSSSSKGERQSPLFDVKLLHDRHRRHLSPFFSSTKKPHSSLSHSEKLHYSETELSSGGDMRDTKFIDSDTSHDEDEEDTCASSSSSVNRDGYDYGRDESKARRRRDRGCIPASDSSVREFSLSSVDSSSFYKDEKGIDTMEGRGERSSITTLLSEDSQLSLSRYHERQDTGVSMSSGKRQPSLYSSSSSSFSPFRFSSFYRAGNLDHDDDDKESDVYVDCIEEEEERVKEAEENEKKKQKRTSLEGEVEVDIDREEEEEREAESSSYHYEEEDWLWHLLLHIMTGDAFREGDDERPHLDWNFLTGLYLLSACENVEERSSIPSIQVISLYPVVDSSCSSSSIYSSSACSPSTQGKSVSSTQETIDPSEGGPASRRYSQAAKSCLQGILLLSTLFRKIRKRQDTSGKRFTSPGETGRGRRRRSSSSSPHFNFENPYASDGGGFSSHSPTRSKYSSFFTPHTSPRRSERRRVGGVAVVRDIDDCLDFLLGALSSSYQSTCSSSSSSSSSSILSRGRGDILGWEDILASTRRSYLDSSSPYAHTDTHYRWRGHERSLRRVVGEGRGRAVSSGCCSPSSTSAYLRGRSPLAEGLAAVGKGREGGRHFHQPRHLLALTYDRCEQASGTSLLEGPPSHTIFIPEPSPPSSLSSSSSSIPSCCHHDIFSLPSPLDELVFLDTRAFYEPNLPSPPHPLLTGLYGTPCGGEGEEDDESDEEEEERDIEEAEEIMMIMEREKEIEKKCAKGRIRMHRLSGVLCVQAAMTLLSTSLPSSNTHDLYALHLKEGEKKTRKDPPPSQALTASPSRLSHSCHEDASSTIPSPSSSSFSRCIQGRSFSPSEEVASRANKGSETAETSEIIEERREEVSSRGEGRSTAMKGSHLLQVREKRSSLTPPRYSPSSSSSTKMNLDISSSSCIEEQRAMYLNQLSHLYAASLTPPTPATITTKHPHMPSRDRLIYGEFRKNLSNHMHPVLSSPQGESLLHSSIKNEISTRLRPLSSSSCGEHQTSHRGDLSYPPSNFLSFVRQDDKERRRQLVRRLLIRALIHFRVCTTLSPSSPPLTAEDDEGGSETPSSILLSSSSFASSFSSSSLSAAPSCVCFMKERKAEERGKFIETMTAASAYEMLADTFLVEHYELLLLLQQVQQEVYIQSKDSFSETMKREKGAREQDVISERERRRSSSSPSKDDDNDRLPSNYRKNEEEEITMKLQRRGRGREREEEPLEKEREREKKEDGVHVKPSRRSRVRGEGREDERALNHGGATGSERDEKITFISSFVSSSSSSSSSSVLEKIDRLWQAQEHTLGRAGQLLMRVVHLSTSSSLNRFRREPSRRRRSIGNEDDDNEENGGQCISSLSSYKGDRANRGRDQEEKNLQRTDGKIKQIEERECPFTEFDEKRLTDRREKELSCTKETEETEDLKEGKMKKPQPWIMTAEYVSVSDRMHRRLKMKLLRVHLSLAYMAYQQHYQWREEEEERRRRRRRDHENASLFLSSCPSLVKKGRSSPRDSSAPGSEREEEEEGQTNVLGERRRTREKTGEERYTPSRCGNRSRDRSDEYLGNCRSGAYEDVTDFGETKMKHLVFRQEKMTKTKKTVERSQSPHSELAKMRLHSVEEEEETKKKMKGEGESEEREKREDDHRRSDRNLHRHSRIDESQSCSFLGKTLQHLLLASSFLLPLLPDQKHVRHHPSLPPTPSHPSRLPLLHFHESHPSSSSLSSSLYGSSHAPESAVDRISPSLVGRSRDGQAPVYQEEMVGSRGRRRREEEEEVEKYILTASLGRWISDVLLEISLHYLTRCEGGGCLCRRASPSSHTTVTCSEMSPPSPKSHCDALVSGNTQKSGKGCKEEGDMETSVDKERKKWIIVRERKTCGASWCHEEASSGEAGEGRGRYIWDCVKKKEKKEERKSCLPFSSSSCSSCSCLLKNAFLAIPSWALGTLDRDGLPFEQKMKEKKSKKKDSQEEGKTALTTHQGLGQVISSSSSLVSSEESLGHPFWSEPWLPLTEETVAPDREKLLNLSIRFSLRSLHICARARDLIRATCGEGLEKNTRRDKKKKAMKARRERQGGEEERRQETKAGLLIETDRDDRRSPEFFLQMTGRRREHEEDGRHEVARKKFMQLGKAVGEESQGEGERFGTKTRLEEEEEKKRKKKKAMGVVYQATTEELEDASKRIIAKAYGHLGNFYAETGRTTKAIIHCKQGIELFEALGDTRAASDLHLALSCFLLQPLFLSPFSSSSSSSNFKQVSLKLKDARAPRSLYLGCSSSFSSSSLAQEDKAYLPSSSSSLPFSFSSSSLSYPSFASSRFHLFLERYCTCLSVSSSSSPSFSSMLDGFSSLTSGGQHDSVISISLSLLRAAEKGYFSSGSDLLHSSVRASGMVIRKDRGTCGTIREREEKKNDQEEEERQQRSSSLSVLPSSSFSFFSDEENRHLSILLQCISRLEQQERRLHCAIEERLSRPLPPQPLLSSSFFSSSSFSSSSFRSASKRKETLHAYQKRQQPSTASKPLSACSFSSSSAMERTRAVSCSSSRGAVSLEEEIIVQGQEEEERSLEKVKKEVTAGVRQLGEADTAYEKDRREKIKGGVEKDEREESFGMKNDSIKGSPDSCLFCSLHSLNNDRNDEELIELKRLHGGVCTLLACLYIYLVRWQLKAIPLLVRPHSSRESERLSSYSKTRKQDQKKIDGRKESSDGDTKSRKEISTMKKERHAVKSAPTTRERGQERREEEAEEEEKEQGREEEEKQKKKDHADIPLSTCEEERTRENDKKKKRNLNGHLTTDTPLLSSSSSPPSCSSSTSCSSRLEECWYASEVVSLLPFGLLPFLHLQTATLRDLSFSASADSVKSREERRDGRRKTGKEAESTHGKPRGGGGGVLSGESCMDKEKEEEKIEQRDRVDEEKEEEEKSLTPCSPHEDKPDVDEEEDTTVSLLLEKMETSLKRVVELYEVQESLLVSLYHRLSLLTYGCRADVIRNEEHGDPVEMWRQELQGRRGGICRDHIEFGCQRLLVHNAAGLAHLFLSSIALREVYVHSKKHPHRTGKEGNRENRSLIPSRRRRRGNGTSRDITGLGGEVLLCKNLSLSLRMKIRGKLRSALYHAERAAEALQSCCFMEGYQKNEKVKKKTEEEETMNERRILRAVSAEEGKRKERKKTTKMEKEEKREEKGGERQQRKAKKKEKEEEKIYGEEERRTRVGLERETTSIPLARRLCERCHLEMIDTHTPVYVHHPNPPYTAFVSSCLLLSFTHELVSRNSPIIPLSSFSSAATSSHSLQTFSSSSFLTSSTISSSPHFFGPVKFLSSPRMREPKQEGKPLLQSEERCFSSLRTSGGRRRRERRQSSEGEEEVKKVGRTDERTSERESQSTAIGPALQAVRRIACICCPLDNLLSTASCEEKISISSETQEAKEEEKTKSRCQDVVVDCEKERERQVSPLWKDGSVGLLFLLRNEEEKKRSLTQSLAGYPERNISSPKVTLFSPENTELFRKLMKDTNGRDRGREEDEEEEKMKNILNQRKRGEEKVIVIERRRRSKGIDEDNDGEEEEDHKRIENERETGGDVTQPHKQSIMVDMIEDSCLPLALQECTLQRFVYLLLLGQQDDSRE
ncbi:hypothetical protein CSUI_002558 [Cystoisospora suis]|uniref:Uncharacterized protein n=1 Tax=Cystoisospora suis TaxID=483139 RepID=A0A2C6KTI1_9APIC|nr:hypothetical protein CSUI_002558 [Cystoisospora suis]